MLIRLQTQKSGRILQNQLFSTKTWIYQNRPIHLGIKPYYISTMNDTQHSFSTNAQSTSENKTKQTNIITSNDNDFTILYKRDPKRTFFPRVLFGSSMVHSAYWLWYVLDFIPAVNAANIEMIQVNPSVGYVGFTLSAIMLGAATIYPKYLIGEIAFDTRKQMKCIKCHTFPFMTYERSKYFELDAHVSIQMDAHPDKKQNLGQHQIFPNGHIPITVQNMNGFLLLDLPKDNSNHNEIKDKLNLQAFLMGWGLRTKRKGNRNQQLTVQKGQNNDEANAEQEKQHKMNAQLWSAKRKKQSRRRN